MKTKICTIVPILLLCFMSIAMGEKQRRAQQTDRIPKIDIIKAVQLVTEHHQKNNPAMQDVFVDEAVFVRKKDKSFWKIGVRLRERETGHLYYKLTSQGKVESHSVVKDG